MPLPQSRQPPPRPGLTTGTCLKFFSTMSSITSSTLQGGGAEGGNGVMACEAVAGAGGWRLSVRSAGQTPARPAQLQGPLAQHGLLAAAPTQPPVLRRDSGQLVCGRHDFGDLQQEEGSGRRADELLRASRSFRACPPPAEKLTPPEATAGDADRPETPLPLPEHTHTHSAPLWCYSSFPLPPPS
jgi:hypothetical protein